MKKIILVLMILLLGGCYDYDELTDLGIIASMIIDKKDDEFSVNLEVLETKEDAKDTSFFLEGKGPTFENALIDAYTKTSKHIYFNHMFSVIVSKNLAESNLNDIYDYFLIDADVRKDSYFVICDKPEKLIDFKTEDMISIGETIKNIIHYNELENGNFRTSKFREILNSNLNDYNYLLGSIKIDDNMISLSDVYLIKDNKLDLKIDTDAILLANLLNDSETTFLLTVDDEAYEAYKYKMKTDVQKDKIKIDLSVDIRLFGKIKSKNSTIKDMQKIENKIKKYLTDYIDNCINYMKSNEKDIYAFDFLYYKYQSNNYYKDIFKDLDYEIDVKVNLNEKGLRLNDIGDDTFER